MDDKDDRNGDGQRANAEPITKETSDIGPQRGGQATEASGTSGKTTGSHTRRPKDIVAGTLHGLTKKLRRVVRDWGSKEDVPVDGGDDEGAVPEQGGGDDEVGRDRPQETVQQSRNPLSRKENEYDRYKDAEEDSEEDESLRESEEEEEETGTGSPVSPQVEVTPPPRSRPTAAAAAQRRHMRRDDREDFSTSYKDRFLTAELELNQRRAELADKEREVDRLEQKSYSLAKSLSEARAKGDEAAAEAQTGEADLRTQRDEADKRALRSETARKRAEAKHATAEMTAAGAKLTHEAELEKSQTKVKKLQAVLDAADKEKTAKDGEISKLQILLETSRTEAARRQANSMSTKAKSKITDLELRLASTEKDRAKAATSLQDRERDLRKKGEELQHAREQGDQLSADIKSMAAAEEINLAHWRSAAEDATGKCQSEAARRETLEKKLVAAQKSKGIVEKALREANEVHEAAATNLKGRVSSADAATNLAVTGTKRAEKAGTQAVAERDAALAELAAPKAKPSGAGPSPAHSIQVNALQEIANEAVAELQATKELLEAEVRLRIAEQTRMCKDNRRLAEEARLRQAELTNKSELLERAGAAASTRQRADDGGGGARGEDAAEQLQAALQELKETKELASRFHRERDGSRNNARSQEKDWATKEEAWETERIELLARLGGSALMAEPSPRSPRDPPSVGTAHVAGTPTGPCGGPLPPKEYTLEETEHVIHQILATLQATWNPSDYQLEENRVLLERMQIRLRSAYSARREYNSIHPDSRADKTLHKREQGMEEVCGQVSALLDFHREGSVQGSGAEAEPAAPQLRRSQRDRVPPHRFSPSDFRGAGGETVPDRRTDPRRTASAAYGAGTAQAGSSLGRGGRSRGKGEERDSRGCRDRAEYPTSRDDINGFNAPSHSRDREERRRDRQGRRQGGDQRQGGRDGGDPDSEPSSEDSDGNADNDRNKRNSRETGPSRERGEPRFGFGEARRARESDGVTAWFLRTDQEGEDFYLDLSPPWNVLPDVRIKCTTADIGRNLNNGILSSFGGEVAEYCSYRGQFIQLVHMADVDIGTKYNALKASVKALKLRIVNGTQPGPRGYRLLIEKLEELYGGEERLMNYYHDQLAKIRVVHRDNLEELEELVDLLEGYHSVIPEEQVRAGEGHSFAVNIFDKLEKDMGAAYVIYCENKRYKTTYDVNQMLRWIKRFNIMVLRKTAGRERRAGVRTRAMVTTAHEACPVCGDRRHHVSVCDQFLRKKPSVQLSLIVGLERCVNCCEAGHIGPDCEKPTNCKECTFKHLPQFHGLFGPRRRTQFAWNEELTPAGDELLESAAMPPSEDEDGPEGEQGPGSNRGRGEENGRRANVIFRRDPQEVYQPGRGAREREVAKRVLVTRSQGLRSFAGRGDRCNSLRYVTFRIINPVTKKARSLNAILDDGANLSTIDSTVAEELGLKGESYDMIVNGFGGKVTEAETMLAEVLIENLNGRVRRKMLVETFDKPLGELYMADWRELSKGWEHMQGAFFNRPAGDGRVDMIIGTDQAYFHRSLQEKFAPDPSVPVARLTPLGWNAIGQMRQSKRNESNCAIAAFTRRAEIPIRRIFHQQINILPLEEVFADPPLLNAGDRKVVNDINHGSRQLPDGRMEVPVLWAGEDRPADNLDSGLREWAKQKASMDRNPELRATYDTAFNKWVAAGYVKEISMGEARERPGFYIPHFGVVRDDKATTKLRIVLNGKYEVNGRSLNSFILPGPKIFNHIISVLLGIRRFRLAGISDVKEMFLRIALRAEDRCYHRLIYTPPGEDKPRLYEFYSHVFGNCGSPAVAVITAKMQGIKFEKEWPAATEVVLKGSIVDDNLFTADSLEELTKMAHGIQAMFTDVAMSVHKWAVTDERCLPPGADTAEELPVQSFPDDSFYADRKALGLLWNSKWDKFTFRFSPRSSGDTYLDMLRVHMSLYDPLGLLLPFVIVARLIYRDMWTEPKRLGMNRPEWSDRLLPEHAARWTKWKEQLPKLGRVLVDRHLRRTEATDLFVFTDASFDAYGAVAYLSGPAGPVIVASKARTNKDASASINRLELQGAVLGLEMAQQIWRALDWDPAKTTFYVDNRSVLTWVRNPGREVDRFAARRVAMIRLGSHPSSWHYVETGRNPADIVSRGMDLEELTASSLWWHGPDFLLDPAIAPVHDIPSATHEKVEREELYQRLIANHHNSFHGTRPSSVPQPEIMHRISDWNHRLRVAAQIIKAIRLFMCPILRRKKVDEPWRASWKAEDMLICFAQHEAFPKEMSVLALGASLPVKHEWRRFDVRCENYIIYIKGRAVKLWRPVLQHSHPATLSLLRYLHECLGHSGGGMTLLAESRHNYWIFRGVLICKKVCNKCVKCRRIKPRRMEQKMGDLPSFRTASSSNPQWVFDCTFMDFCGPFETIQGRFKPRMKRYFLIFTCARVRAVHVEMCLNRSTDEVMMALQRFASRRGLPRLIISDNAKEFRACARSISKEGRVLPKDMPNRRWDSIEWRHYRSLAPHMGGGGVESMVKLVKGAMEKTWQGGDQTDFELLTLGIFAEDVVNRRPICSVSEDVNDRPVLTPLDFLMPGRVGELQIGERDLPDNLTRTWEEMNESKRVLWEQLCLDYNLEREKRQKWHKSGRDIQVGELVMCMDLPLDMLGRWPLARVIRVDTGTDFRVRSVTIQMNDKEFDRHVKSLAPLFDTDEEEPLGKRN